MNRQARFENHTPEASWCDMGDVGLIDAAQQFAEKYRSLWAHETTVLVREGESKPWRFVVRKKTIITAEMV